MDRGTLPLIAIAIVKAATVYPTAPLNLSNLGPFTLLSYPAPLRLPPLSTDITLIGPGWNEM